ncbi:hypothetical protein C8R43DRAFT_822427, partial [Mycena crocata]
DKKTKFWNHYKTLADEHDKEFLQKYSTDLDTSLIFAGLFSGISSAFILQIQPELQSGPSEMNQALVRLLIQVANGTFSAESDIFISASPPPSLLVIAAQSLLYICLSTTLTAAFLAVLGKQW